MKLLGILASIAFGACGGAPAQPPDLANVGPVVPHEAFDITLERTMCFGTCPAYKVTLHDDGRVVWKGADDVAVKGEQTAHVSPDAVLQLREEVDRLKFFDRGTGGMIPKDPACLREGSKLTCDYGVYLLCTDTSHTVLTVRRGATTHTVDLDHCSASPLDELEKKIDEAAGSDRWIGTPPR